MRRTPKYWILLTLGLCLLSVGSTVAIVYWRHTVPLSQTSEVYRRYRDLPGVRAAYIRQMPINDTLRLDMTLFEAEDSLSFTNLLRTMGNREEFIRDLISLQWNYNIRFSGECPRGKPAAPPKADPADNEVVSYFPVRMAVALFHTHTEKEVNSVLIKSFFGEIDIDKHH